jgi:hypothetical protein
MLNLDSFTYANSASTGSMTLEPGKSTTVFSGNISISASVTSENAASVTINRKDNGALKKPILTSPSTWRAPDASILDTSYTDTVNDIADFEARIDGVIKQLSSSKITDWKPTYLNPFTPPQVLQLKDLPEGRYSLAIRVRNLSGQWSPWSDPVQANIDRGLPVLGTEIGITRVQSGKVVIELSGVKDVGSGLCSTQLVNPEGWILERSLLKANPEFLLNVGEVKSGVLQTFDCLGNGRSASFTSEAKFAPATQMKRSGKWSSATSDYPAGSLRCSGKCTAYVATSGVAGVVLGSGSADYSVVGGKTKNVKANKSGESFSAASLLLGSRNKSVKVSGSNFVLVGVASAQAQISNVGDAQAFASEPDRSLDDPIQKVLNRYGFNNSDFSSEWYVVPMGRGTTLEDPTLDLCSAQFDSELLRKERRQVLANKKGNTYLFLSTESVRYRTLVAAEQALSEVKLSYANCVKNLGGTERDGAFTKYEFLDLPNLPANLAPASHRVIVYAKIGEAETARYLFGAYQYQGDMFTGLYVVRPEDKPFSQDEIVRWLDVAGVMAERLKL